MRGSRSSPKAVSSRRLSPPSPAPKTIARPTIGRGRDLAARRSARRRRASGVTIAPSSTRSVARRHGRQCDPRIGHRQAAVRHHVVARRRTPPSRSASARAAAWPARPRRPAPRRAPGRERPKRTGLRPGRRPGRVLSRGQVAPPPASACIQAAAARRPRSGAVSYSVVRSAAGRPARVGGGDQLRRVEPDAVVGAGQPADVLLHQRAAEVVDAPAQRLGRRVEAHLHPRRLQARDRACRARGGRPRCA